MKVEIDCEGHKIALGGYSEQGRILAVIEKRGRKGKKKCLIIHEKHATDVPRLMLHDHELHTITLFEETKFRGVFCNALKNAISQIPSGTLNPYKEKSTTVQIGGTFEQLANKYRYRQLARIVKHDPKDPLDFRYFFVDASDHNKIITTTLTGVNEGADKTTLAMLSWAFLNAGVTL